jgi:RNA polymerase sigma factor (sigma-70 family)
MPTSQLSEVIQRLRVTLVPPHEGGLTDGDLLERYINHRDEAAFAGLVRRHGPMVWGVCRRIVGEHHEAEDAFQATFLVLVRKASAIAPRHMVVNWLYGTACQTALKARASAAKKRTRERLVVQMPEPAVANDDAGRDLHGLLDQELSRLPDKYRVAIVLCDLEGRTRKEAARRLRVPEGTLSGRLSRGRAMLAKRLARHGLPLAGAPVAVLLTQSAATAGVPRLLVSATLRAAAAFAAEQAAATGVISPAVAALVEGVLKTVLLKKLKIAALALLVVLACIGGGALALPSASPSAKRNTIGQLREAGQEGRPAANAPRGGAAGAKAGAEGWRRYLEHLDWLLTALDLDGRTISLDDRRDASADKALVLLPAGPSGCAVAGLKVAPGARITLDGKEARLSDLKPGQRVKVRLAKDRFLVSDIEASARPPVFRYVLKSVDAAGRTVTVQNVEKQITLKDVPVAENAQLNRFKRETADDDQGFVARLPSIALSDLRAGMLLALELTADESAGLVIRSLTATAE